MLLIGILTLFFFYFLAHPFRVYKMVIFNQNG